MQKNPWTPSARQRKPARLMQPIEESGCWYPQDLAGTDAWVYRLSAREIADIFDAVARVEARGFDIKDIAEEDFPLPVLAPALADIRKELMEGRGFALIRGLPIEGRTAYQNTAAVWGVSNHLGRPFSQNGEGHLIGHVMDEGARMKTATGRGYRSNEGLFFHCDRSDITGLFCLQTAKSGGQHRLCSSVALYNEMLARRPDLAEALTFHFYMTRRGEIPVGESDPWYRQPVFSVQDGYFSARGASRTGIVRAQNLPGVPELTPLQLEAIDVYQAIADELAIDIDFEPGDMSYCMSHVTVHARTPFEDWPEPERRRHLLRLWISTGGERPLVPEVAREIERGVTVEGVEPTVPLEPAL
ncbi:MAG: TauD/TfdA family dioxygenase [Alphaproteobacteria bacterium]|nr:TauD/TfdA family dioxygenase [Alphaproteobacteria bacterium]